MDYQRVRRSFDCFLSAFWLTAITAVLLYAFFCVGCTSTTSVRGASTRVTEEWQEPLQHSDGSTTFTPRRITAESVGPAISTSAPEVAQSIKANAQGVKTPNASADGGGFTSNSMGKLSETSKSAALLWTGIALVLAGGALLYFTMRQAATIAFALGGTFIAASFLPEWAWACIGLALIGLFAWFVWQNRDNIFKTRALTAVVGAVDKAGNGTETSVREHLPGEIKNSSALRTVIDKAKLRARSGRV